jgi:hypothetical protein
MNYDKLILHGCKGLVILSNLKNECSQTFKTVTHRVGEFKIIAI